MARAATTDDQVAIPRLPGHPAPGTSYGDDRLEAACDDRAIDIGASSYRSIQSNLKLGLEQKRASAPAQANLPLDHANVRGAAYYPFRIMGVQFAWNTHEVKQNHRLTEQGGDRAYLFAWRQFATPPRSGFVQLAINFGC